LNKTKLYGLFIGLFAFTLILILPAPEAISPLGWRVVAVVALMLSWWVSEAIPIPATALLPIILFPLLDIMPIKKTTLSYGHYIVFLFMGGFVLALALEKWGIHKRISLFILKMTGTGANGIIGGFMIATAFLSMWMSNTATTVMMLPIASSVLSLILKDQNALQAASNPDTSNQGERYFALSLMLGIAYAANIGGTATLIGTPPNAVFAGFIQEQFDHTISFASWMQIGLPFAIILLLLCWIILTKSIYPNGLGKIAHADEIIETEWQKLGKMSRAEKIVMTVFISTAVFWMFKKLLPFSITDTGIAITAALVLFMLPTGLVSGERILIWDDMKRLPWGILLLFGGGLSIAAAMGESGLVEVIGSALSDLSVYGTLTMLIAVISVALLMTELMSNVALISVLLPVLGGMSLSLNENPLLFTIPATLAASCAFMLPMSTPPNAIVFASGYIRIPQMIKAGIWLNLVSILLTTLFAMTLLSVVFDIEAGKLPQWVQIK